jgi:hypothetical protein
MKQAETGSERRKENTKQIRRSVSYAQAEKVPPNMT